MKKYFAGLLTGLLVTGLATTALAVSGTVSFNKTPIQFNGETISAAGEGYTLSNGCVAPASITYTDEQGGGTTYLPARRVSELMGVDIGWDPATGAVTVTGDTAPVDPEPTATPEPTSASDTTANVPDYSDWSAEDEAAYQEFKGMWEVEFIKKSAEWNKKDYRANYTKDTYTPDDLTKYKRLDEYAIRFARETVYEEGKRFRLDFYIPNNNHGSSFIGACMTDIIPKKNGEFEITGKIIGRITPDA